MCDGISIEWMKQQTQTNEMMFWLDARHFSVKGWCMFLFMLAICCLTLVTRDFQSKFRFGIPLVISHKVFNILQEMIQTQRQKIIFLLLCSHVWLSSKIF